MKIGDAFGTGRARVVPMRAPDTIGLGAWALFYASLDMRVLPVHVVLNGRCSCGKSAEATRDHPSPGKHPRTNHGVKEASADTEQVREWWQRWPEANVGIRTGNGLVVFDVDPRNGGHATWDQIIADHNPPAVPFVVTGGKGLHFFMRDPTGRVRSKKLGDGVDVQAADKYVIAPPSIHPSGRRYIWAKGFDPVATRGLPAVPASLVNVLAPQQQRQAERPAPKRTPRTVTSGVPTPYGQTALDGLVEDVITAPKGTRHTTLYAKAARAGELARDGHLEAVIAFDALVDAGRSAYAGEASDETIARTVRDGILAGREGGAA